MRSIHLAAFILLLLALFPRNANAHGMRTAYVELHERSTRVDVTIRAGAPSSGLHVIPPDGCHVVASGSPNVWSCDHPLAGSTIRIEGLGAIISDAVITNGEASGLVRAGAATWVIPSAPSSSSSSSSSSSWSSLFLRYIRAGFVHVMSGADHLLFLAALVVALRRFRAVVVAETAFTVSHSIALSAAFLGWIHVPSAVAEAAIALSLVLLALDLRSRSTMTPRAGARLAFVFGAVHGFGFAGGLQELGVPRDAVVSGLGGFAVGVEIAQVVFLLACFALLYAASRLALTLHRFLNRGVGYAVGAIGCFWLIERVHTLFLR